MSVSAFLNDVEKESKSGNLDLEGFIKSLSDFVMTYDEQRAVVRHLISLISDLNTIVRFRRRHFLGFNLEQSSLVLPLANAFNLDDFRYSDFSAFCFDGDCRVRYLNCYGLFNFDVWQNVINGADVSGMNYVQLDLGGQRLHGSFFDPISSIRNLSLENGQLVFSTFPLFEGVREICFYNCGVSDGDLELLFELFPNCHKVSLCGNYLTDSSWPTLYTYARSNKYLTSVRLIDNEYSLDKAILFGAEFEHVAVDIVDVQCSSDDDIEF